jgi:gamma-tubulin complex component 5
MSLQFADSFASLIGEVLHDTSRSHFSAHRHRSRRARKMKKNTIGFDLAPREISDSESNSEVDEGDAPETSFSMSVSISLSSDNFFEQLDKMSRELDTLVKFLRRGVEGLAGDASEAASAFGILAFMLEDWDR